MSSFGVNQDRFMDPGIEEALLSLFDLDQVTAEERVKERNTTMHEWNE